MSVPPWDDVKDLLHRAMAVPPDHRGSFLDLECGADTALRRHLESLLRVDAGLEPEFLRSPPAVSAEHRALCWGSAPLAPGDELAGRFLLVRELGVGGMGHVWLAEQMAPVRRPVAIKLIRAGMYDGATAARFQCERQALAIMDHPAIAKVFEAGTTEQGQPYLVMEYVAGCPITDYCDQNGLSVLRRIDLFIEACAGVQHAHQKAIIHRDLKPANILVSDVDGRPTPRIIDFGLAKAEASKGANQELLTRIGFLIGTPGYMSPEQLDLGNRDIDTRADIYSLGVVLYELLTGQLPLPALGRDSLSFDQWLRRLREAEPRRPSIRVREEIEHACACASARGTFPQRLIRDLRGDLDWITLKALERDRDRRYDSVSAFAADLKRFLGNEPVLARPASIRYRTAKFARRHVLAASVAALVGTFAVIASASGLLAMRKAREAAFESSRAIRAQATLMVDAANQHLRTLDVAAAQNIILAVLDDPTMAHDAGNAAVSTFQDVRSADLQLSVLSGHSAKVNHAEFSPDNRQVVTASGDGTARIWDARTGRQESVLRGHRDVVLFASYSPDGTRIVTASGDRTARLWDSATGAQIAVFAGHREALWSAAFSPDGTRIVTASQDGTVRIWYVASNTMVRELASDSDFAYDASFSPDGSRIVAAYPDGRVRIWDSRTGRQLLVLQAHREYVYTARFSPDGAYIVTASTDRTARVWDSRSGARITVIGGHEGFVRSAAFSADGRSVLTSSTDNTARISDVRTAQTKITLSGHSGFVYSAAFSADGKHVVTASGDGTARIWQVSPAVPSASATLQGSLYLAAYSPDGRWVATASDDGSSRILEARTLKEVARLQGPPGTMLSAMFSPDSARVVTSSFGNEARVWDVHTGALLTVLTGHASAVYFAAFSPDGRTIATASRDKTVRIWNAQSGAVQSVLTGHGGIVHSARFSPDGTFIVTGSEDGTARIWDLATGKQVRVLEGHTGMVSDAAFSADGARIVTASGDHTARVWDPRTGHLITVLAGHAQWVLRAAFSPDGSRVVTASDDGTARLWDAQYGTQLAIMPGRGAHMSSAEYSPDAQTIVTTSFDPTVRTWPAVIPADIRAQIAWYSAAQVDPLTDEARERLGLSPDPHVVRRSRAATECDRLAGAPYDPDGHADGVTTANINADVASRACAAASAAPLHAARVDFQMGRVLAAEGDFRGARRTLERAVESGYPAAGIDLAVLLLDKSAAMIDLGRARTLLQGAWTAGIPIAAFQLGRSYESDLEGTGDRRSTPASRYAWAWYCQGARAGEPNALARFGDEEETVARSQFDPIQERQHLLNAFQAYAAAAERARLNGWPDAAWKYWRYRRATLARVLASEGAMQAVADTYAVTIANANQPTALWAHTGFSDSCGTR